MTLFKNPIFVSIIAALAGLLFGLDLGVISGALPLLAKEFNISTGMKETVVSSMLLGAAVGVIVNGVFASRLGRKNSLLFGLIFFIVGFGLSAIAPNVYILIIARVILGFAVGIASFTAPVYLSEIAPERIRGSMISLYQLMIATGIFIAFISDTLFSYSGSWRWMLGVVIFPSAILFVLFLFMPKSPRWLATKGLFNEAKSVLNNLSDSVETATKELNEIKETLKIKQSGWALFLHNSQVRKVVFLGVLLQTIQQFTGINVVMYYAPQIFKMAGFASTVQQMWGTVFIGLFTALATFLAIALVDRWGRRPTLLFGFLVMGIGLGILGFMFHQGITTAFQQYFAIAMLVLFLMGFSTSAGPLVWVLCSEIQPLKCRNFGVTISTTTNWVANTIVGFTFLSMLEVLGGAWTFWTYGILVAVSFVVIYLIVPETKEVSLERIEKNLFAGKSLRHLGK